MENTIVSIGDLLRSWRQRRRLSQLELSVDADISQRHLSFVESGRSSPSRRMLLRLADELKITPRERNRLLTLAGFAPEYCERSLDEPDMAAARNAVELIISGHQPHPALVVDREWNLLLANEAAYFLLEGVNPAFLTPPVNVLRLSLHPDGLAPRVANYRQWKAHVVDRLTHQVDLTADPALAKLLGEIEAYPAPDEARHYTEHDTPARTGIAVPFELETARGKLSFLSTTTVFGTAVDISLSEMVIETFFPMDAHTAEVMRNL
ncbi:MAG: helix-turn-helix transcriptional regulator [Marinobacter sp.]|uniref:helix-turn-helix domain-containing protein n=1 Tax=Marinobacter sp. TaxID=50741 RepID=UPI003298D47C